MYECEWCGEIFGNEFYKLHHHVYKGLCSKDPYPEMRKGNSIGKDKNSLY